MTGTLVNGAAVAVGGLIGLTLKKGLPKQVEQSLFQMLGLSVVVIGLGGLLESMVTVDGATGRIAVGGSFLLLCSLIVGITVGELLHLDERLNGFGDWIERKFKLTGFSKGFIDASIIYCVGALAIIGSLNDGLRGDSSTLFVKSALDGVTSIILGSTLGIGVAFSAVTVVIYQGAITLLAGVISPYASVTLLHSFYMVGYAIVICIGVNLFGVIKIKTANLLPALFIPVVYHIVVDIIR